MLYAMTAVAPAQAQFMKDAGMPLTTQGRITYTEVVAQRRLAYIHLADFIPGVEPYDVATVVGWVMSVISRTTVAPLPSLTMARLRFEGVAAV